MVPHSKFHPAIFFYMWTRNVQCLWPANIREFIWPSKKDINRNLYIIGIIQKNWGFSKSCIHAFIIQFQKFNLASMLQVTNGARQQEPTLVIKKSNAKKGQVIIEIKNWERTWSERIEKICERNQSLHFLRISFFPVTMSSAKIDFFWRSRLGWPSLPRLGTISYTSFKSKKQKNIYVISLA